jgi:uncharacterized protein
MIFVDTSAFFAILDQTDDNHQRALAEWKALVAKEVPLLTNNYVLLETSALLQNRLGVASLRIFHERAVPLLRVDWITPERHGAAVQAALAASRRKLSVVDCASFQSMREHGAQEAFCFDAHFREQGFKLRPE